MDYEKLFRKTVVLKHLPTKEHHSGVVVDYDDDGVIVRMNETAKFFVDLDDLVDMRFTKNWEFVKVKED